MTACAPGTPQARRDGDAWIIPVYVQPGARREGIVGVRGDALKIAVHAPPERGKANAAVQTLLGRELGVRPSAVRVISGLTGRRKTVCVEGVATAAIEALLSRAHKAE